MRRIGVAIAVASCGVVVAAAAEQVPRQVHTGMCDASAGIAFESDPTLFFAANDEDQGDVLLRLYSLVPHPNGPGPLRVSPVSADFLELKGEHLEVDVEGAARIGDVIYWIGSHSASKEGKKRPNRRRLFATREEPGAGGMLRPFEGPYKSLIDDLEKDDRYKSLHLAEAGKEAPKEKDALSIEGLASTPEGGLLIGFRNPIPKGKALLVLLKNPGEVIRGKPAEFGGPIFLDLGGLGVRSIERAAQGRYHIVAGRHDEGGPSRLFRWSGTPGDPAKGGPLIEDSDFNPEALFLSKNQVVVLSDDGSRTFPGHETECKELEKAELKKFRSLVIPAP